MAKKQIWCCAGQNHFFLWIFLRKWNLRKCIFLEKAFLRKWHASLRKRFWQIHLLWKDHNCAQWPLNVFWVFVFVETLTQDVHWDFYYNNFLLSVYNWVSRGQSDIIHGIQVTIRRWSGGIRAASYTVCPWNRHQTRLPYRAANLSATSIPCQNNVLCLSIIPKAAESEKVDKLTYDDLRTAVNYLC